MKAFRAFSLAAAGFWALNLSAASLQVTGLRCEYRTDPAGVDERYPRLSWVLQSGERGQKQTAFQVLVASTPELIRRNQGDLWDTGRTVSDQTIHLEYQGQPLTSRARCFWKVRAWDKAGKISAWSPPARWTMGLLAAADWQAQWIADATTLTSSAPARAHNGYHSEFTNTPDARKTITVDLGQSRAIDALQLFPARPYDWQSDIPGFLFPVRFKIEVSSRVDFTDAVTVVDRAAQDEPNPGTNAPRYGFPTTTAQFVRLTITRLAHRDTTNYAVALAEIRIFSGDQELAQGRDVQVSDSIESGGWSRNNLLDGITGTVSPQASAAAWPATMVRKTFSVSGNIRRATAYVTGLGLYELHLNGQKVGDQLLAPEWTSYRHRVQYQAHDVTRLLQRGENAVGAMLAEGWYAGRLMAVGRDAYGNHPRFLMQLEIERTDGTRQVVATDGSWRSTTDGPIRAAGIYDGEQQDLRKAMPGWDEPDFAESAWRPVQTIAMGAAALVWQRNEPIRVREELKPKQLTEPKPGVFVYDLGQNLVGWCRLQVRGTASRAVTLRHAEVLNPDGTLYTANLRGAPQVDRFILRGGGEEWLEPHFTYHGFRYVEVTGLAETPRLNALTARVFYSSATDAGSFACSDASLNQLMRNIYWTQRGNLMSTPNDCPQRDERFGWMGDIQAFAQTAIFNMDMAAFFSKWVRDIRDDQALDGRFPDFAPHPGDPNQQFSGVPAWGDAGTIVPWRAYQNYANTRLLREHFDAARRWVEYIRGQNPDLIWRKGRGNDYNDWLNGDVVRQQGWPTQGATVPKEIFATAFFAHSTDLVARMARVLGYDDEARRYAELFGQVKTAFNREFVSPDGRIQGDTQAGYALALNFDLLPEAQRPRAVQHMVAALQPYGGRLSTGIQTTHRLVDELTRYGHEDLAWQIVTNRAFPSWLYMLDNGATTVWERWDGYVKGRGFQDPGMNSFNHWAFGAVGEWLWRNAVGLNPDESQPGYQRFIVRPRPGGGVTWARGEYPSIRGRITVAWQIKAGRFTLDLTVPPGTSALAYIPAAGSAAVREGGRPIKNNPGVRWLRMEGAAAVLEVQSGIHKFDAPWMGPARL